MADNNEQTNKSVTLSDIIKKYIEARRKAKIIKKKKLYDNDRNLSDGDLLKLFYSSRRKHHFYGVVSFFMTAMFYVAFTSPDWVVVLSKGFLSNDISTQSGAIGAGIWAILGLLFSISITMLIMHSHTAQRSRRLITMSFLVVLGISFNVFTEVASTMDRVDERVKVKSEQSGIYKALVGTIKNSSGASSKALTKAKNDYADALSTANARCKKGANYDARLCKKWTMRANEYKIAIDLHKEGASSEKAEAVKLAKKASHDSKNAQMVIKLIMEKTGFGFILSTFLISLFIIGTFEILAVMIGSDYKHYRALLAERGIDLNSEHYAEYLTKHIKDRKKTDKKMNEFHIFKAESDLDRAIQAKAVQEKINELQGELDNLYGNEGGSRRSGIGFIDTNNVLSGGIVNSLGANNINSSISMGSTNFQSNANASSSGTMHNYSLSELEEKREIARQNKYDPYPVCPCCDNVFERLSTQQIFLNHQHRNDFNNHIKRLRKG